MSRCAAHAPRGSSATGRGRGSDGAREGQLNACMHVPPMHVAAHRCACRCYRFAKAIMLVLLLPLLLLPNTAEGQGQQKPRQRGEAACESSSRTGLGHRLPSTATQAVARLLAPPPPQPYLSPGRGGCCCSARSPGAARRCQSRWAGAIAARPSRHPAAAGVHAGRHGAWAHRKSACNVKPCTCDSPLPARGTGRVHAPGPAPQDSSESRTTRTQSPGCLRGSSA